MRGVLDRITNRDKIRELNEKISGYVDKVSELERGVVVQAENIDEQLSLIETQGKALEEFREKAEHLESVIMVLKMRIDLLVPRAAKKQVIESDDEPE
jgi:hypothetical protein